MSNANLTRTTPRAPGTLAPLRTFMREVEVGVIGALDSIEVFETDPRFVFVPAPGAERQPITALIIVDDPGPLQVVNCVHTDEATGEVRIRFFNASDAGVDFTQRFIVFQVWPPVAEPTP